MSWGLAFAGAWGDSFGDVEEEAPPQSTTFLLDSGVSVPSRIDDSLQRQNEAALVLLSA